MPRFPMLAAAVATHRLRLDLRTGPSLLAVERDAQGQLVVHDTAPAVIEQPEVDA